MGRRRNSEHLTRHGGKSLRYFSAVPRTLRGVVGQTAWSHYFGIGCSPLDASIQAKKFDTYFDDLIANLRRLSDEDRVEIVKAGGWNKFVLAHRQDKQAHRFLEGLSELDGPWLEVEPDAPDTDAPYIPPPGDRLATAKKASGFRASHVTEDTRSADDLKSEAELLQIRAKSAAKNLARAIEKRRKIMPLAQRSPHGLHGLVDLAAKVAPQSAKSIQRSHLYVDRFIKFLGGDRLPSTITQADAVAWRNQLVDAGTSGVNQEQHLAKMKAMFSHAVSEGKLIANPFAGVKPRYTLEEKKFRERSAHSVMTS